ncbi:hypothetical protein RZN22_18135 [Bacillaceae bacterium S4-13-58]
MVSPIGEGKKLVVRDPCGTDVVNINLANVESYDVELEVGYTIETDQ